jgi:hypothetical protein
MKTKQIVPGQMMKRLDEGKVSLVEFLRSIKYANHTRSKRHTEDPKHFAGFSPQARAKEKSNAEELSLIRSDN